MSRFVFVPALALIYLSACTPAANVAVSASPSPAAASPSAPPVPGASTGAFSALLRINGTAKSFYPNTESPLRGFGGLGLQWGFGMNKEGGPADQVALVLSVGFKNANAPTTESITGLRLSIVPGNGESPETVFAALGDGVTATINGSSMDVHIKAPAVGSKAMVEFDATGVRLN